MIDTLKQRILTGKSLTGKRVVLPDGRRGIVVNRDGEYLVVVTPGCEQLVKPDQCEDDHGNPQDRDTVPF